jgi:hypothetical protein
MQNGAQPFCLTTDLSYAVYLHRLAVEVFLIGVIFRLLCMPEIRELPIPVQKTHPSGGTLGLSNPMQRLPIHTEAPAITPNTSWNRQT